MRKVSQLDCTLRDGGYINDWEFGHSVITSTYKKLDASGVEYIEVGFMDDRRPFDMNRTIAPDTKSFDILFQNVQKRHACPVAMIDFGTCSIDNIAPCEESFLDGIRVIFKKEKIDQALPFCKAIKEKGYKLFIQAISITAYSDMDMLQYIQKINEVKPFAFSIVDTYGLMDKKRMAHYFELIDGNLDPEIIIGYHSHNNFQLAFSNTMEFLSMDSPRESIADSTIYGMGKSAGNCPSELLSLHLNQYYNKNYDINQFLEALDADLMPIYQKHYWGYKYNFYISAMQNCHPNYVQWLLDKKTLTVSAVNEILSTIPEEKKLHYDKNLIESLYLTYQSTTIDDASSVKELKKAIYNKPVLLIGPGANIVREKDKIDAFVQNQDLIIITVNFISDDFKSDYVFVSNAKRYGMMVDELGTKRVNTKIILTSNVSAFDAPADYTLNYQSLMQAKSLQTDNALLLMLSALYRMNAKNVYLAGFDGFNKDNGNYYNSSYSFAGNEEYKIASNQTTAEGIKLFAKDMNIHFITSSLYEQYLSE